MNCRHYCIVVVVLWLVVLTPLSARADITNWQTGETIPGTEGISPGPRMSFGSWNTEAKNLRYADFSGGLDLSGSQFSYSWLDNGRFGEADLAGAYFYSATVMGADLTDAVVARADFSSTTSHGFSKEQLYSTASYKTRDLHGIALCGNDLYGWDFAGQNLTGADFRSATLTDVDLTQAKLAGANFEGATLTNADMTNAAVTGASFSNEYLWSASGLTKEQLYSTASYKARNLERMNFSRCDLSSWDLTGQDLTGASFYRATLVGADLSQANLAGADFYSVGLSEANLTDAMVTEADFSVHPWSIGAGLTKEQLYSTASYKAKDLHGIGLASNNLSGGDFAGQNLAGASFNGATLTGADLSGADMRGASVSSLSSAITDNTIYPDGSVEGLDLRDGRVLLVRDYDADNGPLPITVHLAMTADAGSVLRLIFEEDAWDSAIGFEAGIAVELGGALELTFADGVDVGGQVGRRIRVFDWSGVEPVGSFRIVSEYAWDVSDLYSSGEIVLVPEPGVWGLVWSGFVVLGAAMVVWRNRRSS